MLKTLQSSTDVSGSRDASLFVVCFILLNVLWKRVLTHWKVELNFRTTEQTHKMYLNFLQQGTGMKTTYFYTGNMMNRAGDKIKKNEMGWACGSYG